LISQYYYVENSLHFKLVYFPGADADKVIVMGKFRKFVYNFTILVKS